MPLPQVFMCPYAGLKVGEKKYRYDPFPRFSPPLSLPAPSFLSSALPFSPLPSFPLPSPPLRSRLFKIQLGGQGECCKLLQWGSERGSGRKRIFDIFCTYETHLDAIILVIFLTVNWPNFVHCIPVWQSVRKKCRYDFKPTKEVPVYHTSVYRLTWSPVRLSVCLSVCPSVCLSVRACMPGITISSKLLERFSPNFRVPMPPGKSWIFFFKIPRPGKSWKITLVLESPGKTSLKIMRHWNLPRLALNLVSWFSAK